MAEMKEIQDTSWDDGAAPKKGKRSDYPFTRAGDAHCRHFSEKRNAPWNEFCDDKGLNKASCEQWFQSQGAIY